MCLVSPSIWPRHAGRSTYVHDDDDDDDDDELRPLIKITASLIAIFIIAPVVKYGINPNHCPGTVINIIYLNEYVIRVSKPPPPPPPPPHFNSRLHLLLFTVQIFPLFFSLSFVPSCYDASFHFFIHPATSLESDLARLAWGSTQVNQISILHPSNRQIDR